MNKIFLMGRLTRDPDIRNGGQNGDMVIARYSIAVDRRRKREGEPDADFFNLISFGKQAEFVNSYLLNFPTSNMGVNIVFSAKNRLIFGILT